MTSMSIAPCCLKGIEWEGQPVGKITQLAGTNAYVTGNNPDVAIMYIHDLLGWTWPNARLLADHYAREVNATVYVPDFFNGDVIDFEPVVKSEWDKIDVKTFLAPHTRKKREPDIFACAQELRVKYKRFGATGFCYGGWAVFRLGAKEHQPLLVDAISCGHPTWLTKKDIEEVSVPVQILAPEIDPVYTPALKSYSFEKIPTLGVPFDYQHYPGVEHACFSRGDPKIKGEREAMTRGKNAVVSWFREFLLGYEE